MMETIKAKIRYSISILLGLLGCISLILVITSPNIDSFILEIIIGFIVASLISYAYETTKEIHTKNVASRIRKEIIGFGILVIGIVSFVNFFYNSFFAATVGALLSFVLVSVIYKRY
jgi:hypothetical protein